jgi:MFS family permease
MLAPFVISPIAGVAADRYNRKHVLIWTDLARAATVMGFLLVWHADQVWLLYTLTAIQLGISGFFFPARNAILPDIVSPQAVGAANAIGSVTWSVMLAFGAAAGGFISGTWGIYPAFVIDALTFLLSALFIGQIQLDTGPGSGRPHQTVAAALGQYWEAIGYLRRNADTLVVTFHKAALAICFGATFQVVQVAIATRVFSLGEESGLSMGLLFGTLGIGTGIGPILARHFTGDRSSHLRAAIVLGYAVGAAGLATTATLANLSTVLAGTLLCGAGNGIIWVFSTQLLLQQVPGLVRGRVFATEFALFTLMAAAGPAIVGTALESPLGIRGVLWCMAAATLVPATLWGLWLAFTPGLRARG